jgi:hypothetical protein
MKCTVIFVFGDARPKNNLLVRNFTIFESLLFEGYLRKCLQTLYILTNFEVVFLVIFNTRPQSTDQLRNG